MNKKCFAGFALLFLLACATPRKTSNNSSSLNGSWTLSVFQPAQKKPLAETFGTRVVELRFDTETNTVSGTTGCNRFTGTYTADTTSLTFSQNRALTKMACPGYDERLFLTAMDRVNRYRLMEGELELLQNEEIILIFAKKL